MRDATLARHLVAVTLRKFFNFLGWAGLMFIIYGLVSQGTGSIWEPMERWVGPASTLFTLVGVALTAVSVYFYTPQNHPPELFSRCVAAPFTILGVVVTVGWLFRVGAVPPVVVNGFALLGIAGGLFRIQRNPGEN